MEEEIINELFKSIQLLGAKSDLLSIIGSYKDTITDVDFLIELKKWNKIYSEELLEEKKGLGTLLNRLLANENKRIYDDSAIKKQLQSFDEISRSALNNLIK